MVRGGGGGGGAKKKEDNAEAEERKRLKKLAFKNNVLSITQATASGSHAVSPSATMIKHHGKDIIRKSQRSGKNRYLFSFPGLLGPISGGKLGELKDLGTKNPILYLDFPQGQMKLFGTIVYPKNRYLTLQFSRSGKNVTCEDYFDNTIVFSDAWWIGRKDENPEEARLEFPKEMNMEQVVEYDFEGGAGRTSDRKTDSNKTAKKVVERLSPEHELEDNSSGSQNNSKEFGELTPSRKSASTAGKTFNKKHRSGFAEASSGDDFGDDGVETSGGDFVDKGFENSVGEGEEAVIKHIHENHSSKETEKSCHLVLDLDKEDATTGTPVSKTRKQSTKSTSKAKELSHGYQGSLVQATISTLFKKAGEKKVHKDVLEKIDNVKISRPRKKVKALEEREEGQKVHCGTNKQRFSFDSSYQLFMVEDDDIDNIVLA